MFVFKSSAYATFKNKKEWKSQKSKLSQLKSESFLKDSNLWGIRSQNFRQEFKVKSSSCLFTGKVSSSNFLSLYSKRSFKKLILSGSIAGISKSTS